MCSRTEVSDLPNGLHGASSSSSNSFGSHVAEPQVLGPTCPSLPSCHVTHLHTPLRHYHLLYRDLSESEVYALLWGEEGYRSFDLVLAGTAITATLGFCQSFLFRNLNLYESGVCYELNGGIFCFANKSSLLEGEEVKLLTHEILGTKADRKYFEWIF